MPLSNVKIRVGDVVTRDGTDRHRVLTINPEEDLIEVECIRAPSDGWCAVGERESNLARRYSYPDDLLIEGRVRGFNAALRR